MIEGYKSVLVENLCSNWVLQAVPGRSGVRRKKLFSFLLGLKTQNGVRGKDWDLLLG